MINEEEILFEIFHHWTRKALKMQIKLKNKPVLPALHESIENVNWHREDDGGVVLCRDAVQSL